MFLLNSRLGLFSAATKRSWGKPNHIQWLLFSRSYEDNLPSSLREFTRAPENIHLTYLCRFWYGHHQRLEIISWKPSFTPSVPPKIPLVHSLALCQRIYLPTNLTVQRTLPIVRVLHILRHPIIIVLGGAGIFNLLPIAYAFPPRLRGRLTQGRRALPWKL